ncbi:MAG: 6-phosphofructokinase [Opitutaceae bacterium]|jgi:6-phosphofructokinase
MTTKIRPSTRRPKNLRVFVSHCVDDKKFVFEVCDLLSPYLHRDSMFLFEERPTLDGTFPPTIEAELKRAKLVLFFVGRRFDDWMKYEVMRVAASPKKLVCIIDIGGHGNWNAMPKTIKDSLSHRFFLEVSFDTERIPRDTIRCAQKIVETLGSSKHAALAGGRWTWSDKHVRWGLPASPNIFDYEKDMIRFYMAKQCYEMLDQGLSKAATRKLQLCYQSVLNDWPRPEVAKTLAKAISASWPPVHRYDAKEINPLLKGKDDGKSLVRAAALVGLEAPGNALTFPEAGPRSKVALPTHSQLKVAIMVAGGIAPGINAVIDAIVQRHVAYHDAAKQNQHPTYTLEVIGLKNGLLAIVEVPKNKENHGPVDFAAHSCRLTPTDTMENATRGGSMLGTSRDEKLLDPASRRARIQKIADELIKQNIDVLYLIGGDGSMKAAHALWHKINTAPAADPGDDGAAPPTRMSVIAIPKTMDNDILWVWQSFGFLSAVEEAREIVERLHTEVRSNPRLGIVQFFGSGSGFVVSHAVLAAATGHTTLALIPEMDFSVLGVARYVKQRLWEAALPNNVDSADPAAPIDPSIPHGLIVMAETAIPVDAMECLGLKEPPKHLRLYYDAVKKEIHASDKEKEALRDFVDCGRRVQGQTNDHLRSLGVKILCEALPILIRHPKLNEQIPDTDKPGCDGPDWTKLRMVRNEPRYLVRALEPSTSDIITGQRLGLLAVDAAMAGFTDCMISQWLTEFAVVPLDLVVLGRKRIPPNGMFWNSVASKTRQPADLVAPYPKKPD